MPINMSSVMTKTMADIHNESEIQGKYLEHNDQLQGKKSPDIILDSNSLKERTGSSLGSCTRCSLSSSAVPTASCP